MGELRPGGAARSSRRRTAACFERALIHPDRNNFAPRFGFAYTAAAKTVIRGAYGMFYNHTNRLGREGLLGFNPRSSFCADTQHLRQQQPEGRRCDLPAAGRHSGRLRRSRDVNLATVARKAQDPDQTDDRTCSSTTSAFSRR